MELVNKTISTCRHCHFYQIEGRRGGFCQQLGVPVQGSWKVCAVAVSPFASSDASQALPALLDWTGIPGLSLGVVAGAAAPQPLLT